MKKYTVTGILFLVFFMQNLAAQDDFYDIDKIQEIRILFKEKNWKHILDSIFRASEGEDRWLCDVEINGQWIRNAGIRYKGYSSVDTNYLKNPFNIDLAYTRKNKNYEGFISLRLGNVNYDPSFIREALSYEIARKYMPASRANFANVYVNDTLLGLYSNVEAVNKKFILKHFPSKDNSFFKGSPAALEYPFGQNANLAYTHGTDSTGYMAYYELESDYGWSDLLKFIHVLNQQPDSIDQVLNIDRALWMHAFNYTLLNFDSYIGYSQNYYIYKDDYGKFNTIPWDLNMSFGSFRETDGSNHFNGLTIDEIEQADPLTLLKFSVSPRPLITNLLANETYKKMFLAHMRTIVDENFMNNEYYQSGQYMQSVIDQAVKNDTNKFYPYGFFKENLNNNVGATGSTDEFPGIKELVEARVAYLNNYPGFTGAPVISQISHDPIHPMQNNNGWITATVTGASRVILNYRYKKYGSFLTSQMADDGNHHDGIAGDGIFGASILIKGPTVQYYTYAENDSAGSFSPERAAYEYYTIQPTLVSGDVSINELMPGNKRTADPEGEYHPWIELCNNTGEDIQLKETYLTNDPVNKLKWQIPDTVIYARSYLIIWADNDTSGSGIHCNFVLSSTGGKVILVNQAGQVIDSVEYGTTAEGKSIGRYPNGWGSFEFMEPTFSSVNNFGTTPQSGFLLYPNPARGKICFEINNDDQPVHLEIYNTGGQLVQEQHYFYDGDQIPVSLEQVDISGFRQGAYYLRLTCRDKVLTKLFVVY